MQKLRIRRFQFLEKHDTDSLRMIIKSSFDPKIKWVLPEGEFLLDLMRHA